MRVDLQQTFVDPSGGLRSFIESRLATPIAAKSQGVVTEIQAVASQETVPAAATGAAPQAIKEPHKSQRIADLRQMAHVVHNLEKVSAMCSHRSLVLTTKHCHWKGTFRKPDGTPRYGICLQRQVHDALFCEKHHCQGVGPLGRCGATPGS